MADRIKRALTRRRIQRGRIINEEPDEKLVYTVKFAMVMAVCLSGLEAINMAFLGSWNSEVFSALMGLVGLVTGVFVGRKT